MRKTTLLFYIFHFFLLPCTAQKATLPLYFDHLTINDGLSHNQVFCIHQDRSGYIWVGTQNGLNKYDGYSFETYNSSQKLINNHGFIGKTATAIFEDRAGNLWVGTQKDGLNLKATNSEDFKNLQQESPFINIAGGEITAITEDKQGNIWLTTKGTGVLKYHPKSKQSTHFTQENSGLSNDKVFDIAIDQYGVVWVGTEGAGVNYLDNNGRFALRHEQRPHYPNMSSYRKNLYLDGEYLWIGTEGTGLYRMNLKTYEYERFSKDAEKNPLNSNTVLDVLKGKDGRIYIATDGGGLNIYDETTNQILQYTQVVGEPNTLNTNALVCFWRDRTDNIWIGTFNGGLNIIKNNKTWFDFFKPTLGGSSNLGHRSVLSIFQSQDCTIWVGTDGGGLNKLLYKNSRYFFSTLKNIPNNSNSLSGNIVKTIFEDSQNQLLIGVFDKGLDVYNPKQETFQHIKNAGKLIWSIAEDQTGRYWIGTLDKGLVILDDNFAAIEIEHLKTKDGYSIAKDEDIMVVFADKQNRMWIGTPENGLYLWEEEKQLLTKFQHDPTDSLSISGNEIRAIFQDSNNQIWIGTEDGGLNRWLGNGDFEQITEVDGLISNNVMGITEDSDKFLWITTFVGISRFNPTTKAVQNFNFHTKINSNQFNQMAALTGLNGKLFFGGINGLNAIFPEQVKEKPLKTPIIFTDLTVFNKNIPIGEMADGRTILIKPIEQSEEIFLNYADNSFSIEFSTIDFTNPEENSFLYKMEGFDTDWQSTTKGQHSAHYTNLDPGTFTFWVKHHAEEANIVVHIQPPFWETLWFRLLVASGILAAILGVLFFIIKRREAAHQQELLEAERKILQLKNENLKTEVNAKNSKLMFSSAQMAHKNEILTHIKTELKTVQKEAKINLRKLLNSIDHELMSEDYWKEFNNYVNQVDKDFVQLLLKKHPKLTPNDLRMCTLLRINLSTKEIASLLNISIRGVEQSRYRLKKRLDLGSEDDLVRYISTLE